MMSLLFRGRVVADLPAALILSLALAAPSIQAADNIVEDGTPPPVAAPQPRVMVRPPIRLDVRQSQRQAQRQAADAAPAKMRKAVYLGVATRPLGPELRAHTELPAGVGLLIDAVSPDSPAARAGVQQFDVLHKFDDQLVCASEQLTALVEVAGKDKEVSLTLLRGGREQVVKATLGEREVAVGGPGFSFEALRGIEDGGGLPFDLEALLQEAVAEAEVLQIFPGVVRSQSGETLDIDAEGRAEHSIVRGRHMTAPLGEGVTAEALIQSLQDNGFKTIEGKTLEQIMPGVNHDAETAGVAVLRDTTFKGSGKGSSEFVVAVGSEGLLWHESHDLQGTDAIVAWKSHVKKRIDLVLSLAKACQKQ